MTKKLGRTKIKIVGYLKCVTKKLGKWKTLIVIPYSYTPANGHLHRIGSYIAHWVAVQRKKY